MTHKFPLNNLSPVMRHEVMGLINMEKRRAYEEGIRALISYASKGNEEYLETNERVIDRLVKSYDPKI